jgi:hypothetical protein
MKVKEMIAILNTYDQESNVYMDLGDECTAPWRFNVKDFDFTLVEKRVDPELKKVAGRPCKETSNSKEGIIIYVK